MMNKSLLNQRCHVNSRNADSVHSAQRLLSLYAWLRSVMARAHCTQRINRSFDAKVWCTQRTYHYWVPAHVLGLQLDGKRLSYVTALLFAVFQKMPHSCFAYGGLPQAVTWGTVGCEDDGRRLQLLRQCLALYEGAHPYVCCFRLHLTFYASLAAFNEKCHALQRGLL